MHYWVDILGCACMRVSFVPIGLNLCLPSCVSCWAHCSLVCIYCMPWFSCVSFFRSVSFARKVSLTCICCQCAAGVFMWCLSWANQVAWSLSCWSQYLHLVHGISFGVLCICSCIILFFHLVVPFAVSSAYSSGILLVSFMEDHCERSLIAFIQLVSIVVSGALSTCVHCGTIRSLIFDDEWTWCSKSLVH